MDFPEYSEMDDPLLYFIYLNGGSDYKVCINSTYDPLANFFELTFEDRTRPRPDGHPGSHWQNRVQWTRQRLINYGFLDGSTKGVWRLTRKGIERAARIAITTKYAQLKVN